MIDDEGIKPIPGFDGPSTDGEATAEVDEDATAEVDAVRGSAGASAENVLDKLGVGGEEEKLATIDIETLVSKYKRSVLDMATLTDADRVGELSSLLCDRVVLDLSKNTQLLWDSLNDKQYAAVMSIAEAAEDSSPAASINHDRIVVEYFAIRILVKIFAEVKGYRSVDSLDAAADYKFLALSTYGDFFTGSRPDFEGRDAQRSGFVQLGFGDDEEPSPSEPPLYRSVGGFRVYKETGYKTGFASTKSAIRVGQSAYFGSPVGESNTLEALYVKAGENDKKDASNYAYLFAQAIGRVVSYRDVDVFKDMKDNFK